jgi:hypothetical protein
LCSGVDALYLSGRSELSPLLFEVLEERRQSAEAADEPQPLLLAGEVFFVEPRSFGKYRYRLAHPSGLFGVTTSDKLPSFYVQPYAEFLHGAGPTAVLDFFDRAGEFLAGGPVHWAASRLDLFCDVQGWNLHGDDRARFVCRADDLDLRERRAAFGGLNFGQRSTNTVYARIYDKTLQIDKKGLDWWPVIWGDRYDRSQPVLRVEFQIGRQGLTEYGVDTPTEALELAGPIWANVTESWLTYRTPTADETRSRWPVTPEWQGIQRATLRSDAIGVERTRALRRKGELRKLIPTLVGYSARVGALVGTDDIDTTLAAIGELFRGDEIRRGISFADRIAERAAEEARR